MPEPPDDDTVRASVGDRSWTTLRVYNNNALLAHRGEEGECVLTGKGIGFGMKTGSTVNDHLIERRYAPDAGTNASALGAMIGAMPESALELASHAVEIARQLLPQTTFGASTIVGLADHLNFALGRGSLSEDPHPLESEATYLFPMEFAAAERIVGFVTAQTGENLPPATTVAIALHLVNATFSSDSLASSYEMAAVIRQVFAVIDAHYGGVLDLRDVNAARFITHLRYLFVRAHSGKKFTGKLDDFPSTVAKSYPTAYAASLKLRPVLALRLRTTLPDDEVAYLALHIERMTQPDTADASPDEDA